MARTTTLLVLLVLLIWSGTAHAGKICFYEHINYGGQTLCWQSGDHVYDLTQMYYNGRYWNDAFSSCTVQGYTRVTIYEHTNYQGARLDITSNIADFRHIRYTDGRVANWNDIISSFTVQ